VAPALAQRRREAGHSRLGSELPITRTATAREAAILSDHRQGTTQGWQLDEPTTVNRGQEVAGLIAEIVQRDSDGRSAKAIQKRNLHVPVMLVLFLILAGFGVWNFLRISAPPEIPVVQVEAAARARLYLTSSSLDAYRRERGTLPATLAEIGLDNDGMTYSLEAGRYTLVAQYGTVRVSYREGQDKAPFAGALRSGGFK
jgi:hypothetical protein